MARSLILISTLGGTATAVGGGYYYYSVWSPEKIAQRQKDLKIKKFKEAVKDYETRQSSEEVHNYLTTVVCKDVEEDQKTKEWCSSIKKEETVETLIKGLTEVSGGRKPYEEMVAEIAHRVPLKNNLFSS